MKRSTIIPIIIFILVGVGFLAYRFIGQDVVIHIRESHIQQSLDEQFPVTKQYLVLNVVLSDPKVTLKPGSKRIHFAVNVTASVPLQTKQEGAGEMSGEIGYNPDKGEFYLTDAKLEQLTVPGLPDKYTNEVREALGLVAGEYLERYPIYKLESDDFRYRVARLFLKSVSVEDGRIRVVMGLS